MKIHHELSKGPGALGKDARSTAPGSFYDWLNRPAASDPEGGAGDPAITELAHRLYETRPDLRAKFPDIFGAGRVAFAEWFLLDAPREYGLDRVFTAGSPFSRGPVFSDGTPAARVLVRLYLGLPASVRARWPDPSVVGGDSFLAWLNAPAAADPRHGTKAPVVTELGAYLHSVRPDVAAAMPDPYGEQRVDYAGWFLSCAVEEYKLDRKFTLPVVRSWAGVGGGSSAR
jgi:hypothetical protein